MRGLVILTGVAALIGGLVYYFATYGQNEIHGLKGPLFGRGVSVEQIGALPLGADIPGLAGYTMRARLINVAPDGIVAMHSHTARPAFSLVMAGAIEEHRSDAPKPITHQAEAVTVDSNIGQWWRNKGQETVPIYVVDIVRSGGDAATAPGDDPAAPTDGTDPDLEGPTRPQGLRFEVHGEIDLTKGLPGVEAAEGRLFRARELVIEAGGILPAHRHEGRPAITRVMAGEIVEYRSDRPDPVLHQAGDTTFDADGLVQWWENRSEQPARLFVVDIQQPESRGDALYVD